MDAGPRDVPSRPSKPEWEEWRTLAAESGMALNTWLRLTVNDGCQLVRTLKGSERRERELAGRREQYRFSRP